MKRKDRVRTLERCTSKVRCIRFMVWRIGTSRGRAGYHFSSFLLKGRTLSREKRKENGCKNNEGYEGDCFHFKDHQPKSVKRHGSYEALCLSTKRGKQRDAKTANITSEHRMSKS